MELTDFVYAILTFLMLLGSIFWILERILWSRKKARNKRIVLEFMLVRGVAWLAIAVLFLFFKNWICAGLFAVLAIYTLIKWISNHV